MAEPKRFIVSDETINSYGFRILTNGGRFDNFKKNPVGFFNHRTGDGFLMDDAEYTGPIIRWEGLSTEGTNLTAIPVFDLKDDLGAAISRKVDDNFIRAASVGIHILKVSEAPEDMLAGQTMPTVTDWELVEISVVDIPSNCNALCLYDAEHKKLELKNQADFQRVLLGGLTNKTKPQMKLKLKAALSALTEKLGWTKSEEGTEREIEISEEQLKSLDSELTSLKASVDAEKLKAITLETELFALKTDKENLAAQITSLTTDKTILSGEITALKSQAMADKVDLQKFVDRAKLAKLSYNIPTTNAILNQLNELSAEEKNLEAFKSDFNEVQEKLKINNQPLNK